MCSFTTGGLGVHLAKLGSSWGWLSCWSSSQFSWSSWSSSWLWFLRHGATVEPLRQVPSSVTAAIVGRLEQVHPPSPPIPTHRVFLIEEVEGTT